MKRPLKAREVAFVLLPALGLGGFAWYQKRVEQVSLPQSQEMFVSSVELAPATSSQVSRGISHTLTVTIDHPWPRPRWWGQGQEANSEVDPLSPNPQRPAALPFAQVPSEKIARFSSGGALTFLRDGKPVRLLFKQKNFEFGYGQWKDDRCVFTHSLSLQDVPASRGALTFHGVYFVGNQAPLRVTQVIRKAGEALPFNRSRNTNGQLVSVHATPFKAMMWSNAPATDESYISLRFNHPARADGQRPDVGVNDSDVQLLDGTGRVIKFDQRKVTIGGTSSSPEQNTLFKSEHIIWLSIDRTVPIRQPLTLRGKAFIDDGWPIPFSIRLPPR